jgi:hypothetical protein
MRWRSYLLVSVILVLLFSSQALAETVTMSVDPNWVVANGRDTSTIRVNVTYFNGSPVSDTPVIFSVNDSKFGYFIKDNVKTGPNGIAEAVFRTKTLSGTANVTAIVNGTFSTSGYIFIDHDTPYSIQYLSYPNNATVGTIQNIILRCQDIHGNIVENRRYAETVTFTVITLDDSRLWNFSPSAQNFSNTTNVLQNNLEGLVVANISIGIDQGETLIKIKPQSIEENTITITRTADGVPWYIDTVRDPAIPFVPANGIDKFVFTYTLYDQYWNKLNNKQIELVAESGPSWGPYKTTTFFGEAAEEYGPFVNITTGKGEIFTTNLIAISVNNSSVRSVMPVEFYDPSPTSLLLTINPKNLPSLDVNSTSKSVLTIAVVDKHGKGVSDQWVNLALSNINTGSFIVNNSGLYPQISNTLVKTDYAGFAYVEFTPGEFSTNEFRAATGQCDITATWNGRTKTVTPIWKNYGYLSVTTWLEDNTVEKDQEVNVSVIVKADGPGFTSRPIDMIFCTDRGGSMTWDTYNAGTSGPVQDKMVYLYEYSHILLQELVEFDDRAGVVSFGPGNYSTNWLSKYPGIDNDAGDDSSYKNTYYPGPYTGYEQWSTLNSELVFEFNPEVDTIIRSLRPFSDPWKASRHNVPTRLGLYTAINDMIGLGQSEPRTEAIRAIVLLTDPEWNEWGDPSAGWDGTSVATANAVTKKAPWDLPESGVSAWVPFTKFGKMVNGTITTQTGVAISDPRQNMANYAKEHDIIIYSIAYPKKDVNIDTSRERILRGLAESTGGMYFEARNGTSLEEIFEMIGKDLRQRAIVNTTAVLNFTNVKLNDITVPGNQTFDYVPKPDLSTVEHKWNASNNLIYYRYRDDTDNWTMNQKLVFDLGTMYLGDLWVVNFTLKAKDYGIVELFEGSYISSDDNPNVVIPPSLIYGGPNLTGALPTESLEITYFNVSESMNAVHDISYSGNQEVQARLYYRRSGEVVGDWIQLASMNYPCAGHGCTNLYDETVLNKWMLGSGEFVFKLEAWSVDAPLDEEYSGPIEIGRRYYIWLR